MLAVVAAGGAAAAAAAAVGVTGCNMLLCSVRPAAHPTHLVVEQLRCVDISKADCFRDLAESLPRSLFGFQQLCHGITRCRRRVAVLAGSLTLLGRQQNTSPAQICIQHTQVLCGAHWQLEQR